MSPEVAAYIAAEREILARLERMRHHIEEDKLGKDCDALNWGDVGDLQRIAASLADICGTLGLETAEADK